jgi:hypothetical protein
MSVRQIQSPWLSDVFSTAGATPSNGNSTLNYAPPSGSSGYIEVTLVSRSAAGLGGAVKVGALFTNVAGTVTVTPLGAPLVSLVASLATLAVTFSVSGQTIQPLVTGVAATNIEHLVDAKYWVN